MTYKITRGGPMFGWQVIDSEGEYVDDSPPRFPTREKAVENVKLVHPDAEEAD